MEANLTQEAAPKKLEQKEFIYKMITTLVQLQEGQTYFEVLDTKGENKENAKTLRKEVRARLRTAILAGQVKYKKDTLDDKILRKDCSSTVSNWIKKDKRLR